MKMTFKSDTIQNLYDDEDHKSLNEAKSHKFTATARVSDFTMLDAIASRFGVSRASLVSDIIEKNILEMYFTLTDKDREKLSIEADLNTTSILEKNGVTTKVAGFDLPQGESSTEDRTWRGYSAIIDRSKESENADS
jgi:hypothetical protein